MDKQDKRIRMRLRSKAAAILIISCLTIILLCTELISPTQNQKLRRSTRLHKSEALKQRVASSIYSDDDYVGVNEHRSILEFIERPIAGEDDEAEDGSTNSNMEQQFQSPQQQTLVEVARIFTIEIMGVLPRKMLKSEIAYFETTLFFHFNIALASQKVQTTSVSLDTSTQEVEMYAAGSKTNAKKDKYAFSPLQLSRSYETGRLSLDILVTGRYYSPPSINYPMLLRDNINENSEEIIHKLKHGSGGGAEQYFKQALVLACTGTAIATETERLKEEVSFDKDESNGGFQMVSGVEGGTFVQEQEENNVDPYGTTVKVPMRGGGEEEDQEETLTSPTNYQNDNNNFQLDENTSLGNRLPLPTNDENSTSDDSAQKGHLVDSNNPFYSFNKQHANTAVYYRTLSGTIFISLCVAILSWNIGKIAQKKSIERKRRIALAKEAYEAPYKLSKKISTGTTSWNSKFEGTRDDRTPAHF